jgi:hypothetical protein
MAVGVRPQVILDIVKGLGMDYSKGLTGEQTEYLLVTMGLGSYSIPSTPGIYLTDGHYLVSVPSLNTKGAMHCILVHIENFEPNIFDPNTGKEGKETYYLWEDLNISGLTKLDDFRDLRKGDKND